MIGGVAAGSGGVTRVVLAEDGLLLREGLLGVLSAEDTNRRVLAVLAYLGA
ncbi:hypothetical protein [Actinoplanes sp. NPDC049316]|uniref:hypothetical protein n=1 Tax=Actinoplanes sp. NPDC049316 TaxID=3154727 RepID=UPI003439267C